MDDLTNSINEGRNDWEKMKFTQPPEEKRPAPEDVRNSGHSTVPSDVSPNAGGGERTIAKKHARWEDTLAKFVNSPENKELRKKLDPKGFNDLKNTLRAVVRRFTMFIAEKILEGQPVDIVSELADTVPQLEGEKNVALKKAQLAIDAFNKQIREYKQSRKTVGMDFTEIPKAKSPEEFQDFLNSVGKTGDHVVDYFLKGATGNPKTVVKRDTPGSGHGGSNVRPVDGEGNVQRDLNVLFSTIQNNPESLNHFNKLLAAIYFFYGEASRLDGSILGLKEKMQRIAASRKSKEKRDAQAVPTPVDMEDLMTLVNNLPQPEMADAAKQVIAATRDSGNEQAAQEMEQQIMKKRPDETEPPASSDPSLAPVNESSKPGPGKVFSPKADVEEKKCNEDIYKDKKQALNEGWKKYSEKNKDAKNGEEPEGFSIVMG